MQWVNIAAGEALTLEQEVFEEGFAYAGCFTFVVWDPAGHGAQTSRCLPSLSPDDVRTLAQHDEPLDVAADDAIAAEQVQSAAAEYRAGRPPVFACSFDARASRAPAWLTLLLATFLMRRVSRRRDPTQPPCAAANHCRASASESNTHTAPKLSSRTWRLT
jgi:hypothetical protein